MLRKRFSFFVQVVWCGAQRCEERDGSGSLSNGKQFFPLGQVNFASGTPTNYFYSQDHLGSTREMTKTVSGTTTIEAQYAYDPYGLTTKLQGSQDADFQYADYYMHAPSGLNLTRTRQYSAILGRWINRDPIEEDGGVNLYAYQPNNPISFIDPSGLSAEGCGQNLEGCLAGCVSDLKSAIRPDGDGFGQKNWTRFGQILGSETSLPIPKSDLGFRAVAGTWQSFTTAANVWSRALGWHRIKFNPPIPAPTISVPTSTAPNLATLMSRLSVPFTIMSIAVPMIGPYGDYQSCAKKCNEAYANCMKNKGNGCK